MSTGEMEQVYELSDPIREVRDGWWDAGWHTGRRPWLIGQAPAEGYGEGSENEDYHPCGGAFSRRLTRALGGRTQLDYLTFMTFWRRRNVLDYYPFDPEPDSKGDPFPLYEARQAADELLAEIPLGRPVIVCGKKPAKAFRIADPSYFEWEERDAALLAPFPHPSGINRFWNEEENVERAAQFLRDVLTGEAP